MDTSPIKARALVVEDDRSWQQILAEILTDMGLDVDIADTIDAAAAFLRAASHRIAVVDLSLGKHDHNNQDGLRVLDEIRLHDPNCVTLLLTGYATVEIAVSSLTEHGAFTCLRKSNFRRSDFRELVHQALAKAPIVATLRPQHSTDATSPETDQATVDGEEALGMPLVLVVEDDAGWRSILSEILIGAGWRVQTCSSFGEGLGYLRRQKYDLAVVDLSLSPTAEDAAENEGYRLLDNARQAGLPTLVVTGTARPDHIERAYANYGAFACIEKQTFDRNAFLQAVRDARDSRRLRGDLDVLTERESEVLALLAQGMPNKEIAQTLFITNNTVKRHLKAIFEKLDVHTRAAAVAKAINAGVPPAPPP